MKIIKTTNAPAAIGPYSQAIGSNGFVYCSGQIALRPDGTFVDGTIEEQTAQVLDNLNAVLEGAGSSLEKVIKTTCYLTNMQDFHAFNQVYETVFGQTKPARATVGVASLPKGAKVEIEVVAEQ